MTERLTTRLEQNECNAFGRSGGDRIKEEKKALTCRENKEVNKNSLSSKDKVESGVYVPTRPPKKPGGKEVDEVNTTTNISRESTITSDNTTRAITKLSKNEKVPNIRSMIKEHEVTGVCLLKDNKHQVTNPSKKEDGTDSTATVTTAAVTSDCESEWNDYITERLAETTTLNDQIYLRLWKKKMGEARP